MPSFFEKLKKGMDIENTENDFETPREKTLSVKNKGGKAATERKKTDFEKENKKNQNQAKKKQPDFIVKSEKNLKKPKVALRPEITAEAAIEDEVTEEISKKSGFLDETKKEQPEPIEATMDIAEQKEAWPEAEGELVIDVFQTENELIVQSAVAGIKPEDLDIDIEKDILIIRGNRKNNVSEKRDYFFQECYWGPFSRKVILPVEVDPGRVAAEMRQGVLTIRLPKILREKKMKVNVQNF